MGCDIHMYLEEFNQEDNEWVFIEEVETFRSYDLFGRLAGVRSMVNCIDEPRGIPKDVSSSIKLKYKRWDIDAHTPGWYLPEEIFKDEYIMGNYDRLINNINSLVNYECLAPNPICRVVFWFDS